MTEVFVGEVLQQYREDPYHFKLPEGESEHEVEQRMVRFIETWVSYNPIETIIKTKIIIREVEALKKEGVTKENILIVSHGCALR
mgnify:CR=1 FL=1